MKLNKYEMSQKIALFFLKPLVHIWMFFDVKRVVRTDGLVDFKRKEPFILLSNHTFLFDVIHVPLKFKKNPYIVASESLFVKQPTKFLFKWVVHVIPKSKGTSDLRTAKMILQSVKKGFPILIFPEGDTTFYGETRNIEFSTMKLIKKLKIDVITCNVKGGYLSRPRWATGKRKRRKVWFDYALTIPKEALGDMTLDDIYATITSAIDHNDYAFQRTVMHRRPGTDLALGLENVVYICPECQAVNSIHTSHNDIECRVCHTKGRYNEFGFIEGFQFDNLYDWDQYQRTYYDTLFRARIQSSGLLSFVRYDDSTKDNIGPVDIVVEHGIVYLSGSHSEQIELSNIKNPIITLRRNLSFTYQDRRYFLQLEKYSASLLRLMQQKY